jgi:hypothetical protein
LPAAEIISQTIVPTVVISAIGLLALVMQNRYARVKDRIYKLIQQRDDLALRGPREDPERLESTKSLLRMYLREARLIKDSMLFAFLSIVFIVVTCFLIMLTIIVQFFSQFSFPLEYVYMVMDVFTLFSFSTGLILLLLCVVSMSRSLMLSISTVGHEISAEHLIDR